MAGVQADTMKSTTSTRSGKKAPPAAGRGRTGVCSVRLLDGTAYEVAVEKNATGEVLMELVCTYINLLEKDYFGITYRDSHDVKFWLNSEKKIDKQLGSQPWNFNFEVKFYPPDPAALQEDITRYQLCLQIRHDILSSKLPCTFITHALLGSYTVQSELGDWDPSDHGMNSEYIKNFHFAPKESIELLDKIAELHRHHKGQTPSEAELHFLENAKKLAMYGIDLHMAQDSDGVAINIGVCASGLVVYRDKLRINRFAWPKIIKISYKRHNFYVILRPGEFEKYETKVTFKLVNHRMAKRLWKTAVESHTFFRLKEAEAAKRGAVFFPKFGSRFRYSGRTQFQTKQHTAAVDRTEPLFERAASKRGIPGARGDGHGRDAHGADDGAYRNGAADPDADQMEGFDEDGREWYRDAQGRKVYKTTTTTTTTTRYIIEGETEEDRLAKEAEERAARQAREEELRRQEQLRLQEESLAQQRRELEEQRALDQQRREQEEQMRRDQDELLAQQARYDSQGRLIGSTMMGQMEDGVTRGMPGLYGADHSERHAGSGRPMDDADYERELVEAILSLTGMSEDIVVEKIQLKNVHEAETEIN